MFICLFATAHYSNDVLWTWYLLQRPSSILRPFFIQKPHPIMQWSLPSLLNKMWVLVFLGYWMLMKLMICTLTHKSVNLWSTPAHLSYRWSHVTLWFSLSSAVYIGSSHPVSNRTDSISYCCYWCHAFNWKWSMIDVCAGSVSSWTESFSCLSFLAHFW